MKVIKVSEESKRISNPTVHQKSMLASSFVVFFYSYVTFKELRKTQYILIRRYLLFVENIFLFFKGFIFSFLERGEGREKEKERNINVWNSHMPLTRTWPAVQACALTRN